MCVGKRYLNRDDEFGIDEREAVEFGLIEIHDEELVGGRELGRFARELSVEIRRVFTVTL